MNGDSDTRDRLALERTRMANERTFLAYIRTGLSLLAAAAVMFQFFSKLHSYIATVWVLVIFGLLVLVIGVFRFYSVNAELNRYASSLKDLQNSEKS
ncbi:YidH family protein [Zhongshania guokunii]|uniref:YidH family protein n=1 Tax=Zhongshania guokunii TaxID=641783 RepID=A0ABV3U218_9GAMM